VVAPVTVIDGRAMRLAVDRIEAEAAVRAGHVDEALQEEIDIAVNRGVEFLDEHLPGWVEKIDLDTLDLAVPCMCVLGQLEGDFWLAMAHHGHAEVNEFGTIRPDWDWSHAHGFSRPTVFDYAQYQALTNTWKHRVEMRRLLDRAVVGILDEPAIGLDVAPALTALDALDEAVDALVDA
jgi:hypothetical protein